jgi:predicted metal-dependent hydrolase
MRSRIQLGDIGVDVVRKDIKNVHLSVHPPTGRVRIAAPERMSLDTVRVFAIAKLPWIKKQQGKLREEKRETPREYIDRESHYVWGKRYLLRVVEAGKSRADDPSCAPRHEQSEAAGDRRRMASRAASDGRPAFDQKMGASVGSEGAAILRPTDEDEMGQLQ